MPANNTKKAATKTTAGKKTTAKRSSQTAKKPSQRSASQRASAKKGEPIVLAKVSKDESWKPLAKTQPKTQLRSSQPTSSDRAKQSVKSKKKSGMTDAKLVKITVGCIFGAIFLIAVLVFIFNAVELKLW